MTAIFSLVESIRAVACEWVINPGSNTSGVVGPRTLHTKDAVSQPKMSAFFPWFEVCWRRFVIVTYMYCLAEKYCDRQHRVASNAR